MSIIGLLVLVLIVCVVLWGTQRLIKAFQVEEPIASVIYVLLVIVLLAYVLNSTGWETGLGRLHL
jgi:hypothetical protein